MSNNLNNLKQDIANFSLNCNQEVDTSVYRNSLWQGFSAIIPNLLLLLFVDKLGFRFFSGGSFNTNFVVKKVD